MNIDKGLIRHWAWLCESEDERMCEGVRFHDIPPTRKELSQEKAMIMNAARDAIQDGIDIDIRELEHKLDYYIHRNKDWNIDIGAIEPKLKPYIGDRHGSKHIDGHSNEDSVMRQIAEILISQAANTIMAGISELPLKEQREKGFSKSFRNDDMTISFSSDDRSLEDIYVYFEKNDFKRIPYESIPLVEWEEIFDQLREQMKNRVKLSASTSILKRGRYWFDVEVAGSPFTGRRSTVRFSIDLVEDFVTDGYNFLKGNLNSNRNRQYHKPNLPKESDSHLDDGF